MQSSAFWSRLISIPTKHPLAFGVAISTTKTSVSDLLVQKVVEQKENVDWRRNAAFAAFGCFYLGGVQYALYVPIFGRMFPGAAAFAAKGIREKARDVKGMMTLGAQVRSSGVVRDGGGIGRCQIGPATPSLLRFSRSASHAARSSPSSRNERFSWISASIILSCTSRCST